MEEGTGLLELFSEVVKNTSQWSIPVVRINEALCNWFLYQLPSLSTKSNGNYFDITIYEKQCSRKKLNHFYNKGIYIGNKRKPMRTR